jgi:hypothetical protein
VQSAPRAPLNLNGRITTSTFARLNIPIFVGPPVILAASRINTTSYAKLGDVLALTARARATSQGRTNLLTLAQLDTVLLTGNITTISRSRIRPFTASLVKDTFDGQIKTASSAQTWLIPSILSGTLAGQIRTTGQARIELTQPSPSILVGRIRAASSAIFSALPTRDLVGQISTTSFATISQANERLSTVGYAFSSLRADNLQFQIVFNGLITSTSWASLPPTQAVLFGRIRANSYGIIPQLPLLPQFQPVVCPIDVDLGDYIDLITSEHISKPKYTQTVTNTVQPYVDDQKIVNGFPCLFDVDVAVGEQEDFTGQWIGKSRYVNLGDVFFSWDVRGLGWDESNWRGPFDPPNALAVLDDEHYRLLLYASIVANHWDGSIPSAYTAWDTLFAGTGYQVVIQDFGNMTMMLGLRGTGTIDAVTQALFQNGNMDLKPAGVSLIDYVFQAQPSVPFFAFDASTDAASGWDVGYWGYLVPPGQGFVPGKTF